MTKHKIVLRILNVILLIILGVLLLLDAKNILDGFYKNWYLILLVYIICNFLAISFLKKSSTYIILTCVFVGLFVSISMSTHNANANWYEFTPLILTGLGTGFLLSYICTRRKIGLLKIGLFSLIISIFALSGFLYNGWKYVIPIALIVYAIYIILNIIINAIRNRNKEIDEDIYVRPSKEKK